MSGQTLNASPGDLGRALEKLKSRRCYEKNDLLFRDGEPCMGIYLIESGEVQLLLPARQKHYKIFDCAGTGAVLGLSEAMSGSPHKMMAEAVGPVEIAYIERMALMNFLAKHCEVCMQIVALLSEDLHGLYRRFRTVGTVEGRKSQPPRTQRNPKNALPS